MWAYTGDLSSDIADSRDIREAAEGAMHKYDRILISHLFLDLLVSRHTTMCWWSLDPWKQPLPASNGLKTSTHKWQPPLEHSTLFTLNVTNPFYFLPFNLAPAKPWLLESTS